jgi:hypothetical protein
MLDQIARADGRTGSSETWEASDGTARAYDRITTTATLGPRRLS